MLSEELDRRCAELKSRMLAARKPDQGFTQQRPTAEQQKPTSRPTRLPTRLPTPPPVMEQEAIAEPITNPHPLIVRTRKGVSKEKAGGDRLVRLASAERLDLSVSKEALPRALKVFDALLKVAEARGIRAAIVQQNSVWRTVMVAQGESIPVCIREETKSVERPRPAKADYWYRPQRDYYPTGHLTFAIDSNQAPRRSWNEGVRQRLENCVDSITKALLATGERLRAARLLREAEEQIRSVESRQAFANERRQREEKERIEALDRDVDRWIRSANIRAYLEAFKACMEKWSGPIQPKSDVGRWLTWARDFADGLDPLEPRRK